LPSRRLKQTDASIHFENFTMMLLLNLLFLIVAVAIIALVLMQRGSGAQAGSGFGAGASGTVFGARGASNFLSKSTKWLAVAFFAIALFMGWQASRSGKTEQKVDLGVMGAQPVTPASSGGALPAVPAPATPAPEGAAQPQPAPAEPAPGQ
jgi:preprotein translocase subunit SecG